MGFEPNEAADVLAMPHSSFDSYEIGRSMPLQAKNIGPCVYIRTPTMKDKKRVRWDDWIMPRTGISFAAHCLWMANRPHIEKC